MAIVLFLVKASITPDQEEAFNRWYNTEHAPEVLRFQGAVMARRYKAIMGEDQYQYLALYEFENEEAFQRFREGGYLAMLKKHYDEQPFGQISKRAPSAYVQVWP